MSETIKELEALVDDLEQRLEDAQAALRLARIAASGVSVGDIVVNSRGQEFRVTGIWPSESTTWVSGNRRKPDGSWDNLVRNLYNDWSKSLPNLADATNEKTATAPEDDRG